MVSQIWAEKSSWFVHGRVVDVKLPDTTTTVTSVSSTSSTIEWLVTQTNLSYAWGDELWNCHGGVGSMNVMKFAGTERLLHPSLVQIKDLLVLLKVPKDFSNTSNTATLRDRSGISSTAAMRQRYRFSKPMSFPEYHVLTNSQEPSGCKSTSLEDHERRGAWAGGCLEVIILSREIVDRGLGERVGEDSSLGYTRRNVDRKGPVVPRKRLGSNNTHKLHIHQWNLNQRVQNIRDRVLITTLDVSPDRPMIRRQRKSSLRHGVILLRSATSWTNMETDWVQVFV
ncbi:hypothetical protein EDD15DRAFT_2518715 [Pisolithus albus]|nr:hypothetical protein EDD15DRAFT_2518715 [Pisolithus albus]